MTTKPVKECAARVRGMDCRHPRAEHSLFCARHAHASNRIHLYVYVSADALDQMMQRDGEQQ